MSKTVLCEVTHPERPSLRVQFRLIDGYVTGWVWDTDRDDWTPLVRLSWIEYALARKLAEAELGDRTADTSVPSRRRTAANRCRCRAEFWPLMEDLTLVLQECRLPEFWARRIRHQVDSGTELLRELDEEWLDELRDGIEVDSHTRPGYVTRNEAKKAARS